MTSFLFFYTHTHLHKKSLIFLHNIHHEYKFPTAFAGLHSHWFETIYSNIIPLYFPLFIFNIDKHYKMGYIISSLTLTFISHLSYYPRNKTIKKIFNFSKYHFIHHQNPKYNKGLNNGLFDKLHGTYKSPDIIIHKK